MREGWKEVKLGEIINIKHGYGFKGEFFSDEETENILLTPGNFNIGGGFKADKLKYYAGPINENFILNENDVIVTMTDLSKMADTLGFSAKIPRDSSKKYLHNQRIGLVELINNTFDLDFIYWLLRTESYQRYIAGSAIGATVKHTSPNKIYTAKVQVPESKETQRKIAKILSNYDDLIENNLKRIKILEEMAQQTYEEWFVRMRFPGYETIKINETTGLPEGWERVKIENLCTVSGGGTPSKNNEEYWINGDINWFTPTDLTKNNSLVITESELKTNSLGISKSSAKVLEANSFVMTSRATIGIFSLLDKPFSTNQGFINVTPNDENLKGYLLYNFITRVDQLKGLATGATFPELSKSKFKVLDIVKPNKEILNNFSMYFEIITKQLFNLTYQNHRLREARDILLPRLMMGLLNVEDIDL